MTIGYFDQERMVMAWPSAGPTPTASVGYRDCLRMVMGWIDPIVTVVISNPPFRHTYVLSGPNAAAYELAGPRESAYTLQ